jgi:spermidine synthase
MRLGPTKNSLPTALMGATLPLLLKTYSQDLLSIGKDVGKLDASNSFGAMVGTLAAGFLLIPVLGIQNSIVFAASINIAIGVIILITQRFSNYRKLSVLGILIILLFVLVPNYDIGTMNAGVFIHNDLESTMFEDVFGSDEILFYKESLYSTVLVIEDDEFKRLTINGKTQCSNLARAEEPIINLAKIPYEVYSKNYGKPNSAVNIGLACGTTSKALSLNLNTTTIEIDPAVVAANKLFYENIDHRLIIDDGRNWLFRNNEKFDLIIVEVFDPYVNRNSMYSQEFFSIQNSRLTENGIAVQWVPFFEMNTTDMYVFFNTFHSVFPYVYAYQIQSGDLGHVVFLGSQKPLELPENDQYMFDHDSLIPRETILSTDDNNFLEFSIARNIYQPLIDETEKEIPIKKLN